MGSTNQASLLIQLVIGGIYECIGYPNERASVRLRGADSVVMEPGWIQALIRCRRASNGTNYPRQYAFDKDANFLYFIAADASEPVTDTPPSTLYVAQLPEQASPDPIPWSPVLPRPAAPSNNKNLPDAAEESNDNAEVSKEVALLRERRRTVAHGITEYSMYAGMGRILLPSSSSLYLATVPSPNDGPHPTLNPSPLGSSPPLGGARSSAPRAFLDAKLSPDGKLVAFIRDADIWVADVASGVERRITDSRPDDSSAPVGPEGGASEPRARSCGVAEYVMQEEFNRFTAYWWSPTRNNSKGGCWEILYMAVDQEEVPIVRVPHYSLDDAAEHYHYPRPGDCNVVSTPYVIPIPDPPSDGDESKLQAWGDVDAKQWERSQAWTMKTPLQEQFRWQEYILRAGWLPTSSNEDENGVYGIRGFWLMLADRRQMRMEVVVFPAFGEGAGFVVHTERCHDWWFNVHDNLQFLKKKAAILYTSERTGCAHVYYKKLPKLGELMESSGMDEAVAITEGDDWIVESICGVDEQRELVYYTSTKSGPLERMLCVSSFSSIMGGENVRMLTEPGFTINSVKVNVKLGRVVYNYSNRATDMQSTVFTIEGLTDNEDAQKLDNLRLVKLVDIDNPKLHEGNTPPWPTPPPEFFTFDAEDGTKLHGALFLPHGSDKKGPFPTVLSVYGGPHVQLVRNERRLTKGLKFQMLAAMGYAVVMIDGRGSHRRGVRFESAIKGRFGGAELKDQVTGLEYLIEKGIVDRARIAVTGWSYGAYAGTMLLARWGYLFRVAICGAPVTRWEGYDAAYTERYLGLPDENAAGYAASSVLTYADSFPVEPGRLLLVHSLMDENVHASHTFALIDELIKKNRQHELKMFPRERHGLRDQTAQTHFETAFFNFLTANM